ncbi:MAG: FUSC family protein [Bacteroidales bacterium]|nr:FUSC family protein [Bacteroidales bacterium]
MKRLKNLLNVTDPGFLAAKRSLKTLLAILLSLIIYYNQPKMALLAVIAALLFSRSQTGTTIEERKFTMVLTGLLMTMLSVPVSLISNDEPLSVAFVFLFAFCVFFFIGLKMIPEFPAIVILSLSVVEMAFSHTVGSGLKYSGLFLLVTGLVFILHFLVFPTRPRRRLQLQTGFMLQNLEHHFHIITNTYPDLDTAIAANQESSAKVKKSLNEFRRLWQLFRISATSEDTDEGRLMKLSLSAEKVFDYLVMLWQFRAGAWKSALYRKLILEQPLVSEIFNAIITSLHPETCGKNNEVLKGLSNQIEIVRKEYLAKFSTDSDKPDPEEWEAVLNTLKTLNAMISELMLFRPDMTIAVPHFSIKTKWSSFLAGLKEIPSKLRWKNAAFRFGLRSALIIGIAQAFFRYVEPEYGYWLVLFAVLLIRPNLGISIKNGRDRLLATVIGGAAAYVFLLFIPVEGIVFYTALFIAVYLMVWFANLDKPFLMVIALTFLMISVFTMLYSGSEQLILLRIIYTAGIVLLVIVASSLLWPDRARKKLAATLAGTLEKERDYFILIVNSLGSTENLSKKTALRSSLDSQLKKLDVVMEASKSEVLQVKTLSHGIKIRIYIKRLLNTLHSLDLNTSPEKPLHDFGEMVQVIEKFAAKVSQAFDSLILALRTLSYPENFPELENELASIIHHYRLINSIRREGGSELLDHWHHTAFLWNLKPLINELEGIRKEILQKMNGL